MLNVAIKAARAAGAIINRAALDVESVRISQKQANDFVTEIDQASEAAIIEVLSKAYPDHDFLAEETGTTGAQTDRAGGGKHGAQKRPRSDYVWIIDPLGNVMMRYPVHADPSGIKKDMERLLKVSQID